MHGSLIVGMELRISQLEDKMSDVDARASEEADCNANDRDLDRFIYSGSGQYLSEQLLLIYASTMISDNLVGPSH